MKILDTETHTITKMTILEIDMYLRYIMKNIDIPSNVKYNILTFSATPKPEDDYSIIQVHDEYVETCLNNYNNEDEVYILLVDPVIDDSGCYSITNNYSNRVFISNSASLIKTILHRDLNNVFSLYKLIGSDREIYKCVNIGRYSREILPVKRSILQNAMLDCIYSDYKNKFIFIAPSTDKVWNILELNFRYPNLVPILDTPPIESNNNYFSFPIYLVCEEMTDFLSDSLLNIMKK